MLCPVKRGPRTGNPDKRVCPYCQDTFHRTAMSKHIARKHKGKPYVAGEPWRPEGEPEVKAPIAGPSRRKGRKGAKVKLSFRLEKFYKFNLN